MPRTVKARNRIRNGVIRLIHSSTWKCGQVEKTIIEYLRRKFLNKGIRHASFKEIIDQVSPRAGLTKKATYEYVDAIERLWKRNIVKVI